MLQLDTWYEQPVARPSERAIKAAGQRQSCLTKPAGALGDLEQIAITLAGHQGRECPRIDRPEVFVFAGDHGVAARGVSAFPQSVTAQMVLNFLGGGAAISVLARLHSARLTVVDTGVIGFQLQNPPEGFLSRSCNPSGTRDFSVEPAMSQDELHRALATGRECVEQAISRQCDVFIAGEMGIGNTTSASALACALMSRPAVDLVGLGTGITTDTRQHKCQVVDSALSLHAARIGPHDPLQTLRCLGGYEIAAITGAALACAQYGLTFLVDGFIASVAALVAVRIQPACRPWMLFAHRSAEAGHNAVLSALDAQAVLQLNMRLGEASGAAVALPLLSAACALHAGMATFEQAGVDDRDSPSGAGPA